MMPGCLWDGMFRVISSAKLGLEEEMAAGRYDLLKIYPNFETDGPTIVAHNICNKEYIEIICQGLEEGGLVFKR